MFNLQEGSLLLQNVIEIFTSENRMIYAQQAWRRHIQYIPRSPSWNLKRPEFRNQRVSYMYGRSALLNTRGTYPEGKQRL